MYEDEGLHEERWRQDYRTKCGIKQSKNPAKHEDRLTGGLQFEKYQKTSRTKTDPHRRHKKGENEEMKTQGRILIKQEEPRTTHSSVLGSVWYNRESVHLYRHLQHTALAMATEAPPTCF